MLMINENQTNRNSTNNNRKQQQGSIPPDLHHILHTRDGLTGSCIEIHPSTHGKDNTRGFITWIASKEDYTTKKD